MWQTFNIVSRSSAEITGKGIRSGWFNPFLRATIARTIQKRIDEVPLPPLRPLQSKHPIIGDSVAATVVGFFIGILLGSITCLAMLGWV